MKPIKLTLQAFGPYAGQEEIDFRDVTKFGIFGIYGPTGSGKSTIFSAISFALFGEPARKDQQPASLRSDHAPANLVTRVEFIFELGANRFLIRREPDQERPRQRGEGMTTSPHHAWLFDVTGLDVDHLSEENTGSVLAEKKVSKVREKIQELVGYGPEQFKQTILLPQGQFETFLAANTDNRKRILRELFDVSIFTNFTAKLKEDAHQAEIRVRDKLRLSDQQLNDKGFESLDALETAILDAEAQLTEAFNTVNLLRSEHEAANKNLLNVKAIDDQFVELEKAQAQRAELEVIDKKLAPKRDQVKSVKLAVEVLPYGTRCVEAIENLKQMNANFDQAENNFVSAEKALGQACLTENNALSSAKVLPQIQNDLARLNGYLDSLKNTALSRSHYDVAKHESAEASGQYADAKSLCENLESRLQLANEEVKRLTSESDELKKLESELYEQRQYEKETRFYLDIIHALNAAKQIHSSVALECDQLEERVAEKTKELEIAEAALSGMQAVHLAGKLQANAPCPVCGSEHHPDPAGGTAESKGLDEAFRNAKEQLELENLKFSKAKEDRASAEASLRERNRQLSNTKKPEVDLNVTQKSICEISERIEELSAPEQLQQAQNTSEELRKELEKAQSAQTAAEAERTKKLTALANTQGQIDGALNLIPEFFRDENNLKSEIEARVTQITALSDELEVAKKQKEVAGIKHAQSKTALGEARKQLTLAESLLQKDREKFLSQLGSRDLSEASYVEAMPLISTINGVELELKEFDEKFLNISSRISTLLNATAAIERPVTKEFQNALTAAAEARDAAVAAQATSKANKEQLEELQKKTLQRRKDVEKEEEGTAALRTLAALCSANNDYRLDLETYAIGAIFDQVLAAANMRLKPMSSGRYSMERNIEAGRGNVRKGLGIAVNDVHTGRPRDISTLSGGETFIAALSLALGLSDVVERHSGGIRLDTIFIDEGFGTLDSDDQAGSLDKVLEVLNKTVGESRSIGLISHVGLVQRTIPTGFRIDKYPDGSRIKQNLSQ
jgi:DNA repair protein SbcC/Rad50